MAQDCYNVGIAQWGSGVQQIGNANNGRVTELLQYASDHGGQWWNFDTQVSFIFDDELLNNTQSSDGIDGPAVDKEMKSCGSLTDCTATWLEHFEATPSLASCPDRAAFANLAYDAANNNDAAFKHYGIPKGDAVELLSQARRMTSDGLTETRRALDALTTDAPPLPEGLADLSAAHQRRHQARVRFKVVGPPRSLSPDAGLALTRTAQEALVNTAKHAPHQPVEVRLDYEGESTSLTVVNKLCDSSDHPGPALETANAGYGLAGMRERLRLLQGSLRAGTTGDNWVVTAQVPQ